MSMIAKTEKNLSSSIPVSKPSFSIKSIIKDLQDLDKSLITKNEMQAMKSKMKMLEEENSRIKAELQATEADRKLYYNQFHQNVKEVCELRAENETLKAEISLFKITEQSNIEEISCSSLQSAISVNDTRSNDGREKEARSDDLDSFRPPESGQISSNSSKRSLTNENSSEQDRKKTRIQPTKSKLWKCTTEPCIGNRFDTIEHLRSHIADYHPERKYMCDRCPYSTGNRRDQNRHTQHHVTNELKFHGVEGAKKCSLCDIYFQEGRSQGHHNKKYH